MQLFFIFFISIIAILEFVALNSLNKELSKQKSLKNTYMEKKQKAINDMIKMDKEKEELIMQYNEQLKENAKIKKELTNAKRKITNLEKKIEKK